VPEQQDQDDNRQRDADQPQQDALAHRNAPSPPPDVATTVRTRASFRNTAPGPAVRPAMSTTPKRTDPKLWERVKDEVTAGDKGGEKGEWSARKAQLAVQEYKKRGGGYEGRKDPHNSLAEWGKEDWGTKSGANSGDTHERYLPRKAREALSDAEYRRTTAKKRADTRQGRQHSAQPKDVAEKTRAFRDHRTRAELYEQARQRDLPGRSRMTKAELASALAKG
jgi:hypothetical protein